MIGYLIRRILYAVPILMGVSLLTFILFFGVFSPQMLARKNLSAKNPTPKQIQKWIADHGYDRPKSVMFEDHMKSLLLLQFGKSDKDKEDIWGRIRSGAGPSLLLGLMTFGVTLFISLTLAVIAAYLRGTYVDGGTTAACVVLMSVPMVVYIFIIQYLLGKLLHLGPIAGYESGWNALRYLILPTMVGVAFGVGLYIRYYRTFLLDEINQDYVRTARAKGVSESRVLFRHVLKNAMVPVVTTVIVAIPQLILGSLLVESFFGIPGLGTYLQNAITDQDFAVVRAMVYLGTLLYIFGLILTDVFYGIFDPRIRFR